MYNSFGVIQNNKKDLTARYIVHYVLTTATSLLTVRQLFTLIFSVWPFHSWKIILYYYNKNCYEHHKVSSKFYKNILPLRTIALWHIVNRTAVQNKVTTRFNKLIYFFKDVQCTFFLIQGFRVSGYFYLHIYRPQTALITSENADKEQSLNCYLDATNRSQNSAASITGRDIQRLKKSLWKKDT